jgi:hypothetical protein
MEDRNTLIARFQITNWEETQLPGVDGDWANGAANPDSWFGYIVNGTGSGDLAGVAGSAVISHDDKGAHFTFVLE